ncbi:hypothetical protein LUZ61_009884 [Rhynchospora tenuis]|uniref:AIG1-type G domain-containing protein n=1 Tax=Rhynchospora tenuis TaxID=198213 RepID=A0AAD6EYU7_9POAL|nr:hypothetical protein LUZ61_009884 [Rhynchospora tenuis]
MGGSSTTEDDWELASINDAITLVLVGKLGYGKSATGNSIVGRNVFESSSDMSGVTCTCQMESTVLSDGRKVNVIDTPGLFDWSVGSKEIGKEIIKCVKLAKDGIHAVILVFSIRSRFSEGEETILERLQMFFGESIVDYMVLVFTGGDDLDEERKTFQEYLSKAPEPVKTIIKTCKNRVVLFNNRTKDQNEKDDQVQMLMFYVNRVMANNGGKPFSDEIFSEIKLEARKLHDEEKVIDNMRGQSAEQIAAMKEVIYKSYNDQLTRITEMVMQKLNDTIERLEKELAKERAARLKSNDEIHKLKESLEKAHKGTAESDDKIHKLNERLEEKTAESHDKIRKLKEKLEKAQKESAELKAKGNCAIL